MEHQGHNSQCWGEVEGYERITYNEMDDGVRTRDYYADLDAALAALDDHGGVLTRLSDGACLAPDGVWLTA